MSLEEYMQWCGGPGSELGEWEEGVSIRELASSFTTISSLLETLDPPREVADWHYAVLALQTAVGETLENYVETGDDRSEDEFLLSTLFPLALEYQPAIDGAIAAMEEDVRDRMVAAGCIEEEFGGQSVPQIDATELTVGEALQVTADPDLGERYSFQAEQGKKYFIEITGETLSYFVATSPVADSQMPQTMRSSGSDAQVSRTWEAPTSDRYAFQVVGDDAGTYTVMVWLDLTPPNPSNVRASWDGTSIEVSWEPVEEADYYNLYHDDLGPGCSVGRDGQPSFCDEVATNVVGTTFVHTNPDPDENFYWVTACNQEGCSKTDPQNPAEPSGELSGGPTTGGPCEARVTLEEGQFCTVNITSVDLGTDRFEVREGKGCFGATCADEEIIHDEFIAYANRDGSWDVTRAPTDDSN